MTHENPTTGEPPHGLSAEVAAEIIFEIADRWPLVLEHATPGGYPSIVEQAAARGEPVPVGARARDLRARGYRVPAIVSDYHEVVAEEPDERVDTSTTGRRTGFAWYSDQRAETLHWCRTAAPLNEATDRELLRAYAVVVREALEMGETPAGRECIRLGLDVEAVARVETELQRRENAYAALAPSPA